MSLPTDGFGAWRWVLHAEDGSDVRVDGYDDTFASQSDAESWIGEVYPDLLDHGVVAGTLVEGDREAYRMSLEA
ncbi:hypothetical protein Back2_01120 [Nocardioides baekrokdamisoli]|uniref:Uncharacterized protein n=1 Tax=Nocardioides baekrokdamisoli TaxID=1804624 RepID=A0A3G9IIG9_9ACTN|nr:hypothetical protein [Nocardioides baekrokdamisoli]BBH15825.1 hypothetical protein Back2_01120 [Nocardioides baekrokdamisoli]